MNPEGMRFHAGRRLAGLIAAGQLPPDLLRQAALGRLALPFGDRLFILVALAARGDTAGEAARQTLGSIPAAEVARVVDAEECPAELRQYFRWDGPGAEADEEECFQLVEASEEERAELAVGEREASGPRSTLQKLAGLKVQERARRAMLGTREERMLLVRDASRIVQRAVLGSPRLTENDVELIAAMRNVDEQVLRAIGGSRRWRQSLNIIRNLVNNSRTPADLALQLIKHLFPPDLRRLAVNHNVQEAVRRGAERLLAQREA